MPVCVHCAQPVSALLAKFGSGHVALVRCGQHGETRGCGRRADPYLEYGPTIVLIDLLLAKPRVYRHLLYNRHVWHVTEGTAAPPAAVHARRFLAYVLAESYLRWFFTCVHPARTAGRSTAPGTGGLVPAPLGEGAVVFAATLAETLALHTTVSLVGTAVQWAWHRTHRRPSYWPLFSVYLPSVALLFSNISTVLLLALVLLWNSRTGAVHRPVEHSTAVPLAWLHEREGVRWLAPLAEALQEWDVVWLIRHGIGGFSAGMSLGAVALPIHPAAGVAVLCLGSLAQSAVGGWFVHCMGPGVSAYCQVSA
ncbi:sterol homeostasis protein [Malassezia sp. CBS 17886]|nr:sterol homeostasis protein [Malassezia sp. CBS 17886]